jgi:hypothetical protein
MAAIIDSRESQKISVEGTRQLFGVRTSIITARTAICFLQPTALLKWLI